MNGPAAPPGQAAFAAALLDPALPCPPGLRAWNGSDPARRLAVYRNNVVGSLVDALASTFEVTQQLVGTEFFRAMAAVYVRRHPPRSRILAHYGGGFPAFVADFEPAAALPYLADVARLEFARVQAGHAADAAPIAATTLAQALADPQALAEMRLQWHASLQPIESPYAVVTLWAAHQGDGEIPTVEVDHAEQALVLRDGLEVLVLPADAGGTRFVDLTRAGATFGAAAAAAASVDPGFDLGATLARLLRHGALVALHGRAPGLQSQEAAP